MNRADLRALEVRIDDCVDRLIAARANPDLAHQVDDLDTEHTVLVARWHKLAGELGLLAA